MIYDAFTFFNELDVLEIRLQTLDPVVDKFILVEASQSFSGLRKPMVFAENRTRFARWADKIIYVPVKQSIKTNDRFEREIYQRNAILRGLKNAKPNDYIMISDVDEIPYPETVGQHLGQWGMTTYYYKANLVLNCETQYGTASCLASELGLPHDIRQRRRNPQAHFLEGQCWHFSFFHPDLSAKIGNFSHSEFDTDAIKDPERLQRVVAERRDIFDRPYTLDLKTTRLPDCLTLERYPGLFA